MSQLEAAIADCTRNQDRALAARQVMFCGRCGHATGGGYGHHSSWCKRSETVTSWHFCCVVSCELVDGGVVGREASCHPTGDGIVEWAIAKDAATYLKFQGPTQEETTGE